MKTFKTMLKVEWKLSLRDMNMFIFAICMPVVILFILGMIYNNSPAFTGASYSFIEQSFGALSTIAIGAGGLMGLPLVISDYRHKKILKRYQVTPISPVILLFVQTMVYVIYSFISLGLVYITSLLFFDFHFMGSMIMFLLFYMLVMISMFSIGMMIGGLAPNMKIASVLASLLYFPMLLFSGTTLPYEIMPKIVQHISDILPLTQGIKLLKNASLGLPIQDALIPILCMICITIICTSISIIYFKWE